MAKDTFDNKDEMDAPQATDTLGSALVIVTTIILLGALFVMQKAMGEKYNVGMFKDESRAAAP
jgi:hypothetical protein